MSYAIDPETGYDRRDPRGEPDDRWESSWVQHANHVHLVESCVLCMAEPNSPLMIAWPAEEPDAQPIDLKVHPRGCACSVCECWRQDQDADYQEVDHDTN